MKVKITMESVQHISKEYDVTEEELERLKNGFNPFEDELLDELDRWHGVTTNDYAVCDEHGNTIVDWGPVNSSDSVWSSGISLQE